MKTAEEMAVKLIEEYRKAAYIQGARDAYNELESAIRAARLRLKAEFERTPWQRKQAGEPWCDAPVVAPSGDTDLVLISVAEFREHFTHVSDPPTGEPPQR